jgi:hypothetical protein
MSKFKNVILLYLFSEALYSSSQFKNEIQFAFGNKLYLECHEAVLLNADAHQHSTESSLEWRNPR